MLEFILYILILASLSVLAIVTVRGVPRVNDKNLPKTQTFESWLESLPVHQVDTSLRSFLHKALRKIHISILKIDNLLSGYLDRVKEDANGSGRGKFGMEELLSLKEEKKDKRQRRSFKPAEAHSYIR